MKKLMLFIVGLTAMLAVNVAWASEVLYVDAAAPGADPGTTWEDLSASGYDFANDGAIYNATNKSYEFHGTALLEGTGDESIFDFDTAKGTGADPFTIVAYFNVTAPWDAYWPSLISKAVSRTGWQFTVRSDVGTSEVTQVVGSLDGYRPTYEVYCTANSQFSHSTWQMLMMTVDGSGTAAGVKFYANGSTTPMTLATAKETLDRSILTDATLLIGSSNLREAAFTKGFQGEIGFIEIWDELLDPTYGTTRWNNGDPVRGEIPPSFPGDANGNGVVDEADAAIMAANWLATAASWEMGDFNNDQIVDDKDATIMASNWHHGMAASVPEPSMLALLGAALAMLMFAPRLRIV